MADDKIDNPEEKTPPRPETEDIFKNMSAIEPLRDEELETEDLEGDGDEHGTLEERIDSGRKLTDFQTLDKRLNPDLGYRHLNVMQMSRVFPDVYNPLFRILVKDLIKNSNLSVAEAIATVNTAISIPIDGEGRIDNIVSYTKGGKETTTEQNKGVTL